MKKSTSLANSSDRTSAAINRHRFSDVLRLTGLVTRPDANGNPIRFLKLRCWNMTYTGIADCQCIIDHGVLKHMNCIEVLGDYYMENGESVIYLSHIRKTSTSRFMSLPSLYTLPKDICPLPSKASLLVDAVQQLKTEALRVFIKLVLERSDRLELFLKLPASQNDHHAYPGGLLEHSLQVAKNLVTMIEMNEPDLPIEIQEAGFVAGLLHDIGKLKTYNLSGHKQPIIGLVDHDQLTLEMCSNGLAYLDQVEPDIALLLRHIWTSASPGARYGMPAKSTLARYLRDADGQSAMSHNQRSISRNYELKGFRSRHRQNVWIPSVHHQA